MGCHLVALGTCSVGLPPPPPQRAWNLSQLGRLRPLEEPSSGLGAQGAALARDVFALVPLLLFVALALVVHV